MKTREQVDLERAHFLVTQAFEEDEKGNVDEAIELYTQAVELCIQTVYLPAVSQCKWIVQIHVLTLLLLLSHQSNVTQDQVLQSKLKQLARQALDRYFFLAFVISRVIEFHFNGKSCCMHPL